MPWQPRRRLLHCHLAANRRNFLVPNPSRVDSKLLPRGGGPLHSGFEETSGESESTANKVGPALKPGPCLKIRASALDTSCFAPGDLACKSLWAKIILLVKSCPRTRRAAPSLVAPALLPGCRRCSWPIVAKDRSRKAAPCRSLGLSEDPDFARRYLSIRGLAAADVER